MFYGGLKCFLSNEEVTSKEQEASALLPLGMAHTFASFNL